MTDEERDRTMDFILAQQAKYSVDLGRLIEAHRRAEDSIPACERENVNHEADAKEAAARRKPDRDMDRIERVLQRIVSPSPARLRQEHAEEGRWREFQRQSNERWAEIKKVRARIDRKRKALAKDIQKPQRRSDS